MEEDDVSGLREPEEVSRRAGLLLVRDIIARKRSMEHDGELSASASAAASPAMRRVVSSSGVPTLSLVAPRHSPHHSPPLSPLRTVPVLRAGVQVPPVVHVPLDSAGGGGALPALTLTFEPSVASAGSGSGAAGATAAAAAATAAVRGPAWEEVAVSSPAAFNRVQLGVTSDTLHAEELQCCSLLARARALRVRHRVCGKPVYYLGAAAGESLTPVGTPLPLASASNVDRGDSSPGVGLSEGGQGARKPVVDMPFGQRPEPPFTPFSAPLLGHSGHAWRFEDGVVRVFPSAQAEAARDAAASAPAWEEGYLVLPKATAAAAPSAAPASAAATSVSATSASVTSSSNSAVVSPTPAFVSPALSWRSFAFAYSELLSIVHSAAVKGFAWGKLEMLEARFALHRTLNADKEATEQKTVPHRDFYNVRKVDTHVHHSACMNQKHLLRFIKSKLRKESDTLCIVRDGKPLTLAQVFESLGLTANDLSVDTLDMHADWTTMHRFDRFNLKYSPIGQSRLREIFLKSSNFVGGRFLAELTREVFSDLEANKYQMSEPRVSVYGLHRGEWGALAKWVTGHKLASRHVRWMIQLPRLFDTYKATKQLNSFGDLLRNFFEPLFAVTVDPASDPDLHQLLTVVSGVDLVDDESKPESTAAAGLSSRLEDLPVPDDWTYAVAPPYVYWCWYVATNLAVLNSLRAARGFTQLSFRPHCGEAGDPDHLAAGYLTAESINHGILLRRAPALQYLYYLDQVGLAMSPLSNNRLFLEYAKNPFQAFFARGLNVSLSTDDPLMLHYTKEPLLEEYAVAAQVYKLSAADLAELARNSVLQSGFEFPYKAHWIGQHFAEPGPAGNNMQLTNVPHIRMQYRLELLQGDRNLVEEGAALFAAERKAAAAT